MLWKRPRADRIGLINGRGMIAGQREAPSGETIRGSQGVRLRDLALIRKLQSVGWPRERKPISINDQTCHR